MEQVWFSADSHFGHKNIINIGNGRPWDTIEEHDEALIERWNAMIRPQDRVYHLGDFSFANRTRTEEVMSRLRGHKHFIRGNHDKTTDRIGSQWTSYEKYAEIAVEGRKLVLFHFPILSWHNVHKGTMHLHGHCHGNLPEDLSLARMDVGVDTHDYYPWSYEEIRDRLEGRTGTPGDHHSVTD